MAIKKKNTQPVAPVAPVLGLPPVEHPVEHPPAPVVQATAEDVAFVKQALSNMSRLNDAIADNEEQRFVLQQRNIQLLKQRAEEREKKNGRIKTIVRQAGQDPERLWFIDFEKAEIRLTE